MTTPLLSIPEWIEGQLSPHVTTNEMTRYLEALTIRMKDYDNGGPPGSPVDGDTYRIDSATGAWSSFTVENLAVYMSGAWLEVVPPEGLSLWVNDENRRRIWNGSTWSVDDNLPAEGTWTPAMYGSGTAGSWTYSIQAARYTRNGRNVSVAFQIRVNTVSTPATGEARINGLPFDAYDLADFDQGVAIGRAENLSIGAGLQLLAYIEENTDEIRLMTFDPATGTEAAVDAALIISGTRICAFASYQTDAA